MSESGVVSAVTGVHMHRSGREAIDAAVARARNTTIVIGADLVGDSLMVDIDVQEDVCAGVTELIGQLRLILELLEGRDPLAAEDPAP